MRRLQDIAVYETRAVSDALETGSGNSIKQLRGWWLRQSAGFGHGAYLGENKDEAQEVLELKYRVIVRIT